MISKLIRFVTLIGTQRQLIISMAKREISSQYIGSLLGFVWTFINPLVMIAVYWFVFSVGFKARPLNDVPFVVWLTAGLAPWMIFSEIVSSSSDLVVHNAQLIKKTLFKSQILPLVKIVSCSVTHLIFLLILLGLLGFQQMPFKIMFVQVFYYLFCLLALALGFAWALSALNVFIRDIGKIAGILLQVGFWATPVFWDLHIMPDKVQLYEHLNPLHYIVQGYRDSFINFVPFWASPWDMAYFWSFTILTLVVGAVIFQRLKPQFADAL